MMLLRYSNPKWCFGAAFDPSGKLVAAAPAYYKVVGARQFDAAKRWCKYGWKVEVVNA